MKNFKSFISEEEKKSGKEIKSGKNSVKINPDSESLKEAEIQPPAERLKTDRNMYNIPADEREAAKQRLLAKAKAAREKRMNNEAKWYDPMEDPDFDPKEAEKKRGVSGKNNPKKGKPVKIEEGDYWHPDPEQDRKLGGPGANARAREDRAAAAKPKEDPKKLRPGESYMEYAKRRQRGESYVPGKPAERLGAVTAIPSDEREAAKQRTLAKAAALRKKREEQKEEFEINEAEGSYGQTPKATAAYGALANKRRNTPASEYPQRGAKKVAVKSAERHMSRSENPDAGNRGKQSTKPHWTSDSRKNMTQKDRNWRRGADEYGHSGYDGEGGGGSLPKGKKLERQRKTGVSEGMTLKDFKVNRQKNKRRESSADAEKRGHVGKEWYNSGRRYSPDEAKSSRANMDDEERRTRHRSAVDPDNEDDNNYSADKTKNPKKQRKQKAMGEQTMMSFSQFMEARRMDKEGVDRGDSGRAERAAKAKASLAAVKKGEERKIKVSKKYGIEPSKADTVEKRAHKQNHPGSRQAPQEKGKKETPLETQNRRINAGNKRRMTHGWTSKEKAANRGMENAGSRFD